MEEKDILRRATSYCAYQERSHSEVRQKLRSMGATGAMTERIITQLITDDFLNEERFARSFARGKNGMKKWGRIRIREELRQHGVSEPNIRLGLSEIEESVYLSQFAKLCETKWESLNGLENRLRQKKCADFLIYKGYESDLVFSEVKRIARLS
ncbi:MULTISPECIES: regulatory protein RecX [unclassified Flavobacterium]|uniref:regulatory protein RecX n=1 Tax=unclassified Flavobacterium TaxID=196869 RepID=UPI001F139512|nr:MULTISPECIES: regulatory protein RecX [unclassified Flavobacterium]UMY66632.1 RecX family transcriptional regulator [Flavobacterium sp. HJ-32-4]